MKKKDILEINFLEALYGDSILVRFPSENNRYLNILIDGGMPNTFLKIKHEIEKNITKNDDYLIIVTHVDKDHIGGILKLLDNSLLDKMNTIGFWFNFSNYIKVSNSTLISYSDGEILQELLNRKFKGEKIFLNDIISVSCYNQFKPAKITILSPDKQAVEKLRKNWDMYILNKKLKQKVKISSNIINNSESIEKLANDKFEEDSDTANVSSIGFLFEYFDKKILFLADSKPSIIVNSLKSLGYGKYFNINKELIAKISDIPNKKKFLSFLEKYLDKQIHELDLEKEFSSYKLSKPHKDFIFKNAEFNIKTLKLELTKVSHHGSKHNTNKELLDLLDCDNYFISSNGGKDNQVRPDKKCLSTIIFSQFQKGKKTKIFFNYSEKYLKNKNVYCFSNEEKKQYNFECIYEKNIFKY